MPTRMTHNQYVHYIIQQMEDEKVQKQKKKGKKTASSSSSVKPIEKISPTSLSVSFRHSDKKGFIPAGKGLKALSVRQPYAGLIIAGIKNIENRSWPPKHAPGTLAIVSTATPNAQKKWKPMREKCTKLGVPFPEELCKVNGVILGIVQFNYLVWQAEDGVTETDHPTIEGDALQDWWDPDFFGFIFEHPRQLVTPIPLKGQLGLYNLAPEIEAEIKKQMSLNP